jgi:hypothetical protein
MTFSIKDIQHNDIQHNGIQHNDIQHKDIQLNDIQHNDIQHNDIQHNGIQHNDIQHYGILIKNRFINIPARPVLLSVLRRTGLRVRNVSGSDRLLRHHPVVGGVVGEGGGERER